jgi:hypothetical protein
MTTPPKLSTLDDSARRIMAAEALGFEILRSKEGWHTPMGRFPDRDWQVLPDPDQDANDALRLCAKLAEEGQRWRVVTCFNSAMPCRWMITIYDMDSEDADYLAEVQDASFARAITSCFLLAKGLAIA